MYSLWKYVYEKLTILRGRDVRMTRINTNESNVVYKVRQGKVR